MSTPAFPIPEDHLVKSTGAPRSQFRDLRMPGTEIQRGTHWDLEGRRVMWSEEGARRAATLLGITLAEKIEAPEKASPEVMTVVSSPIREVMVRGRIGLYHYRNPRLIQARRKSGELVIVRVMSSENFTPKTTAGQPMQFEARWDGMSWTIDGRAPRWKGRW